MSVTQGSAPAWATAAARVRESVLRHYWQTERSYLADAWSPVSGPDRRLRARQIAAVALPYIAGSVSATTDEATWVALRELIDSRGGAAG